MIGARSAAALRRGCLTAALALLGCGAEPARPDPIAHRRLVLDVDATGLSGLTRDDGGMLWTIPERDRLLVAFTASGVERTVPLRGVPDEVDTEAVTWLGDGRFAIGTEASGASRGHDLVLFARVAGGEAVVEDSARLVYRDVEATPDDRNGIEGLCAFSDGIVAAIERAQDDDAERQAALCVRRSGASAWTSFRLRLTTSFGKLSALACTTDDDGRTVLYAIERGLSPPTWLGSRAWAGRVLRFALPDAGQRLVTPEVVVAFEGRLPDRPNLEGLVVADDGELWLVVDNHYGRVTGPNLALAVRRRDRGASP
ncbi:MAG: esterase-like activity of phytase family protein [Sandaracinaceae bacterium]